MNHMDWRDSFPHSSLFKTLKGEAAMKKPTFDDYVIAHPTRRL